MFWYHYKWPLLIGVVVLGIIVFITVDSLRKERYDTTVVIATDYFVDEEQLDALDEVFKPVVGDLDGNGKVSINYAVLYVGNTEVGRQNQERMYLYMSQEDVGLYLMSQNVSDAFTNPELEYFTDDLTKMGLPAENDNHARLRHGGYVSVHHGFHHGEGRLHRPEHPGCGGEHGTGTD